MSGIWSVLPTKKVTAFVAGGALAILLFWILGPENLMIIEEPDATIQAAATIILGLLFAWFVPESAWRKVGAHEGDVVLPPEDPEH